MLAAVRAELLHLETLGGRLLVFGARVVPVFAFLTLERNDFSRHFSLPLLPAGHAAISRVKRTRGYQPRLPPL
jgi:hypothetical protein